MEGRGVNSSTNYSFGFGGQLKDDEIYGEGNSYNAEYWQYDPRLGRRWNVDPMIKPWESSYAAFGNCPILFSDPDGLDIKPANKEVKKDIKHLRKKDKDFNQRYIELQKQYKDKDLIISNNGSGDLISLKTQEKNLDDKDPHEKKLKDGSLTNNTDYLFYDNLISGPVEVQDYQYNEADIALNPGSENISINLKTDIDQDKFKGWERDPIKNEGRIPDFHLSVSIYYRERTSSKAEINAENMLNLPINWEDHSFSQYTMYFKVGFRAMGIPQIYKGYYTRKNGWTIDWTNTIKANPEDIKRKEKRQLPTKIIYKNYE